MFIGTQYYRPPHPSQEEWERDIQNIVDTGLSMIRIWIYWSQVQKRPDRWAWDDVDAFFDAAEQHVCWPKSTSVLRMSMISPVCGRMVTSQS